MNNIGILFQMHEVVFRTSREGIFLQFERKMVVSYDPTLNPEKKTLALVRTHCIYKKIRSFLPVNKVH